MICGQFCNHTMPGNDDAHFNKSTSLTGGWQMPDCMCDCEGGPHMQNHRLCRGKLFVERYPAQAKTRRHSKCAAGDMEPAVSGRDAVMEFFARGDIP